MRLRFAAMVCIGVAGATAQEIGFDTNYVQLDACKVGEVVFTDVDGDGLNDLVLATEGDDFTTRRIEIHLRDAADHGFAAAADRTIDVPRDVIAFAIADVDPAAGKELVLCSATLAVGMRLSGDGTGARAFRIAPIELLWQPANLPHTYLLAGCVADVDHDGLDDLLIPEPDGYRVLVQRKGDDGKRTFTAFGLATPPVPADLADKGQARLRAQAGSLQVRIRDKDRARLSAVVELEDSVPIPSLCDFDGDGDLDVVALVDHLLCVWPWNGGFARDPSFTFPVPDTGSSLLNPSRSAQLADLDGDHRLDLIAVTGRAQADDLESRVEVYLQDESGHFPDKPDDRLLLRGFVDVPRLCDIDGDGRPELVIGSLRTDVLSALASSGNKTIEAQLNVFRNDFGVDASGRKRSRFGRPVALAERVLLPTDVMRGRFRDRMLATWFCDVDGDGTRDLLQRTDADTVRIRATTRIEGGYELGATLWQTRIDPRARVLPYLEGNKLVLLVLEGAQVIKAEQR